MGPVAAIYDIHGNLPALDAVLAEIQREDIDLIVVGGDVLPGPMPNECLARLFELEISVRFIQGNGERTVLEALSGAEVVGVPPQFREMLRWVGGQLDADDVQRIAEWS